MPFTRIQNDNTKICIDAIVNATNIDLQMSSGVCDTVFKEAGAHELWNVSFND